MSKRVSVESPVGAGNPGPDAHPAVISRRRLLAATAGLIAASVTAAHAQGGSDASQGMQAMNMAGSSTPAGTLSNRLYNVNKYKGVTDIARDPTDLPPPVSRANPSHVRVDFETVELEARLDEHTTYPF
jgi:nitrite reductase (NO-forming)